MSRTFNVYLAAEKTPVFIMADSREDAEAQAREIAKQAGRMIVSVFEIFERPNQFEDSFNKILG